MNFNDLAACKKPAKKKKRYRKSPTHPLAMKPRIYCRVPPLILVLHPYLLDLPPPKYSEDYEITLKTIYANLSELKQENHLLTC